MTQRERHTPEAGAAAQQAGCTWDELFPSLAPARQQELLALAGREGILYAAQLSIPNGPQPGAGAAAPGRRTLLPALLNGQLHDLPPLQPRPVECCDAALDAAQRDAVARALQTPDLCLIQGRPGSGKSRTAAEIVAQAAANGERVLLLAPSAAAVDCVLESLDGRDGVFLARCLSHGEAPESLPPGLRRLVFEERLRAFRDEALPAAKEAAQTAARRCTDRRQDESAWTLLAHLAQARDAAVEESQRLVDSLARIAAEVEAETAAEGSSSLQQEAANLRNAAEGAQARIDARLSELREETEKVRGEQRAAAEEEARLRPLADALRCGRWWSTAWWRARREGDLLHRLEDLANHTRQLTARAERLLQESEEQTAERSRTEERCRDAMVKLRRGEVDRRRAHREQRIAALATEAAALDEQGRTMFRGLSACEPRPHELTGPAVAQARETWRQLLEQDERQAAAAARWAEAVEATMDALPEKLAESVNVVGAILSAVPGDPRFGDHVTPRVLFDLLVLEESHLVTESDFLAAARRARRWVLIGEPIDDDWPAVARSGERRGLPPSARPPRPSTLRPGFFQRLWRLLHADPTRLPYAWFHRESRLVCRLTADASGEERWITSEYLADRPEIELRIAAPPREAPRLLEVVFPAGTAIQDAKRFIFHELGELPVQARGSGFRWQEDAGRLALDVSDGAAPHALAVDLSEGICERVGDAAPIGDGGAAWQTCCLEFDRAAGWTRERAERWVEEHLPTRCLGRTVLLNTAHRYRPALARFLSGLLYDGAAPPRQLDDCLAVEFIPIPSLDEDGGRSRSAVTTHCPRTGEGDAGGARRGGTATVAPRLRASRTGGAGLEVDLADPRRHDPLPPEMRTALPRHGLVNLFEARAVVRKLETLAADPAFRAAAATWAGQVSAPLGSGIGCASASCKTSPIPCVGRRPALAVMALYPAQAELIRLLASQSAALAAAPATVEIGTPDAFHQRECFTALVSLTRSHTHRAVPFGADPALLATALTRAASRVLLFGDPGTLARRCQWSGAVEHLDESAGER
ncbi:MAG TPA: AAA domain-containing protein, partial [Gemmataceae bacterium]|nr:AAA domain-containing protein [Gemmataceae bacterium]